MVLRLCSETCCFVKNFPFYDRCDLAGRPMFTLLYGKFKKNTKERQELLLIFMTASTGNGGGGGTCNNTISLRNFCQVATLYDAVSAVVSSGGTKFITFNGFNVVDLIMLKKTFFSSSPSGRQLCVVCYLLRHRGEQQGGTWQTLVNGQHRCQSDQQAWRRGPSRGCRSRPVGHP